MTKYLYAFCWGLCDNLIQQKQKKNRIPRFLQMDMCLYKLNHILWHASVQINFQALPQNLGLDFD